MSDSIHQLLTAWFGDMGTADLPNSDRTRLWFGEVTPERVHLIKLFESDYQSAIQGQLTEWAESPRGRLALIILLDQFTRFKFQDSKEAYAQDTMAQALCLQGLEKHQDQSLTLIERVFFYMPLVHSENPETQEQSIRLYQLLSSLSLPETAQIYQLFLAYAYAHFRVIKEFGRFPQRNRHLGRESTEAEISFLKNV